MPFSNILVEEQLGGATASNTPSRTTTVTPTNTKGTVFSCVGVLCTMELFIYERHLVPVNVIVSEQWS